MADKKDEQIKAVVAVVVIVASLGFAFNSMRGKSKSVNTSRGGEAVGGPGGPGGGEGGGSNVSVTPASIPQLSPEIKRKIKERVGSVSTQYPKEKLENGVNPFIPYTVDMDAVKRHEEDVGANGATGKTRRRAFDRRMIFWGAFSPSTDEPKRVIIEVVGEPQPWTGQIGEIVDATPYRVKGLLDNDTRVELENPSNEKEPHVFLSFEGLKDETGKVKGAGTTGPAEKGDPFATGQADSGAPAAKSAKARGRAPEPAYEK